MTEKSTKLLTVDATMDNMDKVISLVEENLDMAGCPMKITMKIMVCVEEAYVNIVNYAYGGQNGKCTIELQTESGDEKGYAKIVLRDGGIPFNPLIKEEPDINLSAEERNIGGLGIYMVKNIMDRVDYAYEGKENILTMEKGW